ncbi:MAG: GxxExxY protein [Candidatus Promineifilaceae bacterium]
MDIHKKQGVGVAEVIHKELSYTIIGAAMEVHNVLGPGFLEAVYQSALAHELSLREIPFEQQKILPVIYKGVQAGNYVADYCVEDVIIVEIKAISKLLPQHEAQALNYLAATGFRLALLINFGRKSLEYKRLVR